MAIGNNARWLRETAIRLTMRGFKVAHEPGWETRSNGTMAPDHEAIIVHHTGSINTSTSYIRDGEAARSMLPPYAQIHVRRDATLVIIAAGGASHAGYVHKPCWDRIVAQAAPLDRDLIPGADSTTFSANRPGIGVEVNGAGGEGEWTDDQRAVVIAFCAEYHHVRGWTGIPKVGAHKELSLRKPGDPWEPMGRLRTDVMADMRPSLPNTQEDDMITDDDLTRIAERVHRFPIPRQGSAAGGGSTDLMWEVGYLPHNFNAAISATAQVSASVAALAAAVGTLATTQGLDPAAVEGAIRDAVTDALVGQAARLDSIVTALAETITGLSDKLDTEARDALTQALDRAREAVQS